MTPPLTDRECELIALLCEGLSWECACDTAGVSRGYNCRSQTKRKLLAKVGQSDLTGLRLWASPMTNEELLRLTGKVQPIRMAVGA